MNWVFSNNENAHRMVPWELNAAIQRAWHDSALWRKASPESVYESLGAVGFLKWQESFQIYGFGVPEVDPDVLMEVWGDCKEALLRCSPPTGNP